MIEVISNLPEANSVHLGKIKVKSVQQQTVYDELCSQATWTNVEDYIMNKDLIVPED